MSSADELAVVEEWLGEVLPGDTALVAAIVAAGNTDGAEAIYFTEAPEEARYPFVIYQYQGGPAGGGAVDVTAGFDINNAGPGRVCVQSSWVVKAVGDGLATLPLRPIVVAMDALLCDATGSTATGEVLACKRIGPVSYPEVDGSRRFRHRGGLYRIWSTAEEAP